MSHFGKSIVISFAIWSGDGAIAFDSIAVAAECTAKDIVAVEENTGLSRALVEVEDAKFPLQALSDFYGCEIPSDLGFWFGADVVDRDGYRIGKVSEFLIDDQGRMRYFMVDVPESADLQASKIAVDVLDVKAPLYRPWGILEGGFSRYDMAKSAVNPGGEFLFRSERAYSVPADRQSIYSGMIWETGLNPAARVRMLFSSTPSGAQIKLGNNYVGVTILDGWIRESLIQSIEFHMEGFRPCRFEDGRYDASSVDAATFSCDLKRLGD